MIINTGGRTDTVQYYTRWLLKRFEEGYVLSRNPLFQHKVTRYKLTPDQVDCVVFCSKNYPSDGIFTCQQYRVIPPCDAVCSDNF